MQITSEKEIFRELRRARRFEAAMHILFWSVGAAVAALLIGLVGAAFLDAVDFYAPQAIVTGDE